MNDEATALPSPNSLRGKILIKAKRLLPGTDDNEDVDGVEDESEDDERLQEVTTDGRKNKKKPDASKVSGC